jgi:hypothetical protein
MITSNEKKLLGYFGLIASIVAAVYMVAALLPYSQSPIRRTVQKILSYTYQIWYATYVYYDPLNKPEIINN